MPPKKREGLHGLSIPKRPRYANATENNSEPSTGEIGQQAAMSQQSPGNTYLPDDNVDTLHNPDVYDDTTLDLVDDTVMGGVEGDDEDGRDGVEIEDEGVRDEDENEAIFDLSAIQYGDTDDNLDRTVRAALDHSDVIGAATYEEVADNGDDAPVVSIPFDEEDDEDDEDVAAELSKAARQPFIPSPNPVPAPDLGSTPAPIWSSVPAPITNAPSPENPPDTSHLLQMHQNQTILTSNFEKALAAFAELTGLSRQEYASLREVLLLLKDSNGNQIQDVLNLPNQLSTLISRFRRRLPLLDMRQAQIPLNPEKMPTEARTRRARADENLRLRARGEKPKRVIRKGKTAQVEDDAPLLTAKLTFFDPPTFIRAYLTSDIRKDIHMGPAVFVDYPSEMYHAHCWSGSVRTSSGQYPHLKNSGPVMFPSDWIYYRCTDSSCFCHDIEDDTEEAADLHIGRIYGFGWDMRRDSCTKRSMEVLALQVQEGLLHDDNDQRINDQHDLMNPPHEEDELVLLSSVVYIPETSAYSLLSVYCDYRFGETLQNPTPPQLRFGARSSKKDIHWPKYDEPRFRERDSENEYYYVRRMLVFNQEVQGQEMNDEFVTTEKKTIIPLCHTHPIRGELELNVYGRHKFEFEWDQKLPNSKPVVTLPYINFIDGFGVFSNSYRSLMGNYITPAGLSAANRLRPGNIFPLVLGPHGSDFGDVVKALGTLGILDRGVNMTIDEEETMVCAFIICFTGDMPQQAENSGFKGPRAQKFCRSCYVTSGRLGQSTMLDFDIEKHGRFHHQIKQMQYTMANKLTDTATKDAYGSQWGMANPLPPLESISPALDLVLSRPFDPAHSEYNGLSNLMHFLLRDGILTPGAVASYSLELRTWPFPPGSRRLQSPKHHLASYSMSAHATWSIIIPAFLRGWLKDDYIRTSFYREASLYGNPVDIIIKTCTAIAKSNTLLVGSNASVSDRNNMRALVKRARELFNQLCIFASRSLGSRAGSRAGSVAPVQQPAPGTRAPNPLGEDTAVSTRSAQYMNDTLRPNIHIAVHYPDFAEEYGLTVNCNTLTGEDLHRYFKRRVYETNYSNIEHVLLMKLNVQLTLRLLIRNAFRKHDPDLTAEVQELYRLCPNLFQRVLSHSDRNELTNMIEAEDMELEVVTSPDSRYDEPSIINRIPAKATRHITHPIFDNHHLPRKATNLPVSFVSSLRLAYREDYCFPDSHPTAWDPNAGIQWAHKLGFNNRTTKERFFFSQGDYIQYRGLDNFARIDQIFLFDVYGTRHIFAIITPLRRPGSRDGLLDLEIMHEIDHEPFVIGIMAIESVRPYMVSLSEIGIIYVDWSVGWL